MVPGALTRALATGAWADPGADVLKRLLGLHEAESDLILFASLDVMESVKSQLDASGYADDPEFCMIRSAAERHGPGDPRLVYADALFVGGSVFPGDDVLLAIDTSASDQAVLWLDWSRKPPERWVALMQFAAFVERLAVSSDVNAK